MTTPSLKKNTFLSALKTCSGILLPLITYPYVSRTLGVDALGRIQYVQSIVSYLMLIGAFGFQSYAIREGTKVREDYAKLNAFGQQIHTINAFAVGLAYLIMVVLILFVPTMKSYAPLLMIQSLSVLFYSISTEWVNNAYEDFVFVTYRTIAIQIVLFALTFLLIRSSADIYTYAWILTSSYILTGIMNRLYCRKRFRLRLTTDLASLKQHLLPAAQVFLAQVSTTVYHNTDKTMLGLMCGDYAVGIYAVAVKAYEVIKQLFLAIFLVLIPRLSSLVQEGKMEECRKVQETTLKMLLLFVPSLSMGIYVLAKPAVLFLGGEAYLEAESTLKILAVALMFSAFSAYASQVLAIPAGRYKLIAAASSTATIFNIAANAVLIPIMGTDGAALTTLVSEVLVTVIIWVVIKPNFSIKPLIVYFVLGAMECVYILLVHSIAVTQTDNIILECILTIVFSATPYVLMIYGLMSGKLYIGKRKEL